jgi:LmbE family N-acetylglucosaminyl deacetylase
MHTWRIPQKILVILAHPDDPEFFCGATIAKWVQEGNSISYLLITRGEKGINDQFHPESTNEIIKIRKSEQKKAATILGVQEIRYLNQPDGYLRPSINLRRLIVREIRQIKPDIVVTCDPTNYYMRDAYINHPDHRAAGQIVIDSVFPAVQNPAFYPDLLLMQNLSVHHIKEIWLSLPLNANIKINVTGFWPTKIEALHAHSSQIGDPAEFDLRMMNRRLKGTSLKKPKFEEVFHRIVLQG